MFTTSAYSESGFTEIAIEELEIMPIPLLILVSPFQGHMGKH